MLILDLEVMDLIQSHLEEYHLIFQKDLNVNKIKAKKDTNIMVCTPIIDDNN